MFKSPTKVRCLTNMIGKHPIDLTINQTYRVIDHEIVNGDVYLAVVNDNGSKEFYSENIFVDIEFYEIKPNEINIENWNQWVNNIVKL